MKRFLIAACLAVSAGLAFALPSVDQVQAEVKQGNYAQAETMMREVVEAKPGSARAHYIYAEILAHNKRFAEASAQAARAESIDPKLTFASDAEKFRSFRQLLDREQSAASARTSAPATRSLDNTAATPMATARAEPAARSAGLPGWIWIVGLAVLAWFLWRGFSRSRAAAAGAMGAGGAAYGQPGPVGPYTGGPGYGPGYAPGARPGGGLLGAGLAGAGGFAAGMMADRLLHGGSNAPADGGRVSNLGPDNDTVRFDDPAADALQSRDVDFGSGNGWGGDAGGSFDGGGGGGDAGGGSWD